MRNQAIFVVFLILPFYANSTPSPSVKPEISTGLKKSITLVSPGDTLLLLDESAIRMALNFSKTGTEVLGSHCHKRPQASVIFRGGTGAPPRDCSYVTLENLIVEQQTGNGII